MLVTSETSGLISSILLMPAKALELQSIAHCLVWCNANELIVVFVAPTHQIFTEQSKSRRTNPTIPVTSNLSK